MPTKAELRAAEHLRKVTNATASIIDYLAAKDISEFERVQVRKLSAAINQRNLNGLMKIASCYWRGDVQQILDIFDDQDVRDRRIERVRAASYETSTGHLYHRICLEVATDHGIDLSGLKSRRIEPPRRDRDTTSLAGFFRCG